MEDGVKTFLEGIKVGARQRHGNMTLYCLLVAQEAETDFLTLDEALGAGLLTITETSEAGCVVELRVVNKSARKVVLLVGEELVGAKQNRVLSVTVLLAPISETVIPVSCVEQYRWSYRTKEFASRSRAMSPHMKRRMTASVTANLMAGRFYCSNQGLVWDDIAAKYQRMATPRSRTAAMADLYESHRGMAEDYLEAFHPVDHQVGIIVFIDAKLAGMELLPKFQPFAQLHKKLVHSYVMDALETAWSSIETRPKPSRAAVERILTEAKQAPVTRRESVALGRDLRLESEKIAAAGLEFEGQVVQLSVFGREEEGREPRRRGR